MVIEMEEHIHMHRNYNMLQRTSTRVMALQIATVVDIGI